MVKVSYMTSKGRVSVVLTREQAREFWDKFKHTPAGETATFEDAG